MSAQFKYNIYISISINILIKQIINKNSKRFSESLKVIVRTNSTKQNQSILQKIHINYIPKQHNPCEQLEIQANKHQTIDQSIHLFQKGQEINILKSSINQDIKIRKTSFNPNLKDPGILQKLVYCTSHYW
ncbi:unnamed protein product [Paramecium octaurelia]|uniref:Uncharacterized protein n=1 Tax=Paramecium octaurelia TaxID=43137 RepID=A0A8S1UD84_PAROT|nr:unnamed protein product [Paramecium octaurelia]